MSLVQGTCQGILFSKCTVNDDKTQTDDNRLYFDPHVQISLD